LCTSVWVMICLSLFLVAILQLQHALQPPKCCEPRSMLQFLILPSFSPFWLRVESIKELGVCHLILIFFKSKLWNNCSNKNLNELKKYLYTWKKVVCLFCSNGSWNQGHNDTRKTIEFEIHIFRKIKLINSCRGPQVVNMKGM
jgi:hypothetical protein